MGVGREIRRGEASDVCSGFCRYRQASDVLPKSTNVLFLLRHFY